MTDSFKRDREICDAATPGPWALEFVENRFGDFYRVQKGYKEYTRDEDAAFIAQARTRWPAALDRIEELEAESARWKADYESACKLVAQMHEAAIGEIAGPRVGLVEDVKALREALESISIKGHGYVLHNDHGCPGCIASDALKPKE